MTQKLSNPIAVFIDARGLLLDGGMIYIGTANADPEDDPITVYWDRNLTVPATQPLRTLGGRIVNGTAPAMVFIGIDDYSMRIRDSAGSQVDYSPSVFTDYSDLQPHATNLDTLSAAGLTAFGVAVVESADAAALNTMLGTGNNLSKAGGTMTGDIKRQGAGTYVYWNDAALTSGRIFVTEAGAADPTSQPGDIWLEKSS